MFFDVIFMVQHYALYPDENARDRAVRLAREKYPWATAAAEATVIYSLGRVGRLEGDLLPGTRVEVPGLRREAAGPRSETSGPRAP